MIKFVLDCSVAISWCLVDEDDDYANAVLALMPNAEAFVPEIFTLEIANTLLVAERRNRMTSTQTASAINLIQSLPISIDSQTSATALGATLTLGREQGLASYDAAYLELAIRLGLPLVTLDERLAKAATSCSVLLFNPETARGI
ncbi:MAG: type II toxin-antitoxin system VapC family toxin [Crocosphaera sp.]